MRLRLNRPFIGPREIVRNQATEMSRRRSFVSTLAARQRACAQAARVQYRQQMQAIREAERIRRQQERARIAGQKEQLTHFHEEQEAVSIIIRKSPTFII